MPRTRTVLLLVVAAIVLSSGGRWYRERAQRKRQATASVPNAHVRIPYLEYQRTPLRDVIADLQVRSGVGIRVDWEALRATGVSPEARVDARLANVAWEKALRVALEHVHAPGFGNYLVYEVSDDGTLLVTSQRRLFQRAYVEAYDHRDLFEDHYSPDDYSRFEKAVEALLVETVDPDSWVRHGGPVGLCRVRRGWAVVFQTPENHRSLQILLEQLRETHRPPAVEREKRRLLSRLRGQNLSPEPRVRR